MPLITSSKQTTPPLNSAGAFFLSRLERWPKPRYATDSRRVRPERTTAQQCQTAFCGLRPLSGCAQKRAFWHPFVARVGPPLRVQFPPREPNECNERWWRRWELNPRPQRLGVMRYVRLPGTPRRVSHRLSSAVIQVVNTTMKSPDLPLTAAEP